MRFLAATLLLLLVSACSEKFTDNPHPNQPPETYTSIFTDRQLQTTISRKTLNWWGDDPDGMVVGYIYTFDDQAPDVQIWNPNNPDSAWTFTTETMQTFTLKLSGTDTVYTFRVKAIDDDGAADPTAAVQQVPVLNTRPVVEFLPATDVPETTFTVASFVWKGTDLDGDFTIARYQYVLDDTTDEAAWTDLKPLPSSITLTAKDGLTEGEHVFYLRAVDIAGAKSDIKRMPRNEDDIWYVREPKSKFLLLDDYNVADGTDAFYRNILQSLVGEIDVWDIKSRGSALEPASSEAFTKTLLLFDRIFWYADTDPNLEKAQVSLPQFIEQGGKIFMTSAFQEFSTNLGDPLAFSPVDSLGPRIKRITRKQAVQPADEFAALGYPELQVNTPIIPNVFPLVPKISSKVMYVLPEKPGAWEGTPAVGVIDGTSAFVFFGLPLSRIDGLGTVSELIEKVFTEILNE